MAEQIITGYMWMFVGFIIAMLSDDLIHPNSSLFHDWFE